jgi:hypothetical protein
MFALGAFAQGPPKPEAQIAAMKKLDYMAGVWEGEGWIEMGSRMTFRGTETVQRKLNGLALLVEGAFVSPQNVPVHTTLAVISYDPKTNKYDFDTWLGTGSSGEHELVLLDNGWQWEIHPPMGGVIRYTMTLTEAGEWLEIGERSKDGTEWKKFFEMKLKKK